MGNTQKEKLGNGRDKGSTLYTESSANKTLLQSKCTQNFKYTGNKSNKEVPLKEKGKKLTQMEKLLKETGMMGN